MALDELVVVAITPGRSQLTPREALSQALEAAAERGRPGDPGIILECLPESWGLVDVQSVGAMAEGLLDMLEPHAAIHELHTTASLDATDVLRGTVYQPDPYSVQCRKSPTCDGRDGHPFSCA